MPDNANPVIYGRADSATSKRRYAFLDDSDDEEWFRLEQVGDVVSASGSGSGSSETGKSTLSLDGEEEPIDAQEIFDLIRSVTDPEHPLTLEQLAVVSKEQIKVTHASDSTRDNPHVLLEFTPTIPHCSMATLIGLTLRVRLLRALPDRFKVDIKVKEGTHQSERSVNKQLNDKERVAAALENEHLLNVVQQCLSTAGQRGKAPETA